MRMMCQSKEDIKMCGDKDLKRSFLENFGGLMKQVFGNSRKFSCVKLIFIRPKSTIEKVLILPDNLSLSQVEILQRNSDVNPLISEMREIS